MRVIRVNFYLVVIFLAYVLISKYVKLKAKEKVTFIINYLISGT